MNSQASDPISNIVIGGIDQTLPVKQGEKEILERVDSIIARSVENGDPELGFMAMESLMGVGRVSGLALAKFVYTFKHQWSKFNSRSTFESQAEDRLGVQPVTIKRYNRVWTMLVEAEIPKEYKDKLKLLPMKSLIAISSMLEQGFDVEGKDWVRLVNAPDINTVNKIIREIKKVKPKDGSLQIEWHPEQKQLVGWKSGKPTSIYLNYDENDPTAIAMLERLFSGKTLEK